MAKAPIPYGSLLVRQLWIKTDSIQNFIAIIFHPECIPQRGIKIAEIYQVLVFFTFYYIWPDGNERYMRPVGLRPFFASFYFCSIFHCCDNLGVCSIVSGKKNKRVVIQSFTFNIVQDFAHIFIHIGHHLRKMFRVTLLPQSFILPFFRIGSRIKWIVRQYHRVVDKEWSVFVCFYEIDYIIHKNIRTIGVYISWH